jgi:serpin B
MLQQVDPLTRLILANAIYFEARWDSPFHPPLTRPAPFHRLDGSRVEVQMMSQTCHLSRYEDDHVQAVRLPYTGNRISLVLVAPRLGFFETHGTGPESLRVADRLEPGITQISMPRFRIAAGLQLSRALGELGMPNAFGTTADFSGISPELGFHVDEVLHQTFIDVDEEGTVAAAVTMPIMAGASMPRDIAEITLDRPFVFAIRDEPTGAILFAGRLADPLQP